MGTEAPSGVEVWLTSNVCIDGENYGPDYGRPLATFPAKKARELIKREQAREPWLGPCTRETKRCDTATAPSERTNRCCIEAAVETLRKIQELFDAHDVTWWIDYGTLLGAALDGKFYWNDKDCDIGVLEEDQGKVLRMETLFQRAGFTFSYAAPRQGRFRGGDRVKLRWSKKNRANTDIFFWHRRSHRDGDRLHRTSYINIDRWKGREFPAAWLEPLTTLPFEDLEVPAPKEYLKLVEHRYGKNWRNLPAARHDGVQR